MNIPADSRFAPAWTITPGTLLRVGATRLTLFAHQLPSSHGIFEPATRSHGGMPGDSHLYRWQENAQHVASGDSRP
ncbi:MAG: hypothetical protein P8Z78_01525 [Gammaproteobacteria bacterium]|jgi:hypothetical protein